MKLGTKIYALLIICMVGISSLKALTSTGIKILDTTNALYKAELVAFLENNKLKLHFEIPVKLCEILAQYKSIKDVIDVICQETKNPYVFVSTTILELTPEAYAIVKRTIEQSDPLKITAPAVRSFNFI